MFAVEFTSNRPAGSAPYYSLVIREEPYMVGCLPINDLYLPCHDVSPQHATLEVLRYRQAVQQQREAANRGGGGENGDDRDDEVRSEHAEEEDPALMDPALAAPPPPPSAPVFREHNAGNDDLDSNAPPASAAAAAAEGNEGDDDDDDVCKEEEEVEADADAAADDDNDKGDGESAEVAVDDAEALSQQQEEAAAPAAAATGPAPLIEEDPLVVRLTALPRKGDGAIIVDGHELSAGESVLIENGTVVQFSTEAAVVFRFRPLVVSIEAAGFPADYTRDLVYMLRRLGATLCNVFTGPTPDLQHVPTPIGLLHCVQELNDSRGCLVALACGYSITQPAYVFEWFAALAQSPSLPLSVLPPPSRFEVPVRTTRRPRSTMYIRPESDTCPYSLYPIPGTAMRRRNRADLFAGRAFYFASHASVERYADTVVQCGGIAFGPGGGGGREHNHNDDNDIDDDDDAETAALKDTVRDMVATQPNVNNTLAPGEQEQPYPANFYVIVDNPTEASMLNDGLRVADSHLCQLLEQLNELGATHVPVMGDHSLFTALLSNQFSYEPVQYSVDAPLVYTSANVIGPGASSSGLLAYNPLPAMDGGGGGGGGNYYAASDFPGDAASEGRGGGHRMSAVGTSSASRRRGRAGQPRRGSLSTAGGGSGSGARGRSGSLLPRDSERTPTRSQLRSASRQRQRSSSMAAATSESGGGGAAFANTDPNDLPGRRSCSRGRRQLTKHTTAPYPTIGADGIPEGPLPVGDRFDILRVRIYAFLVKEEPRLDLAIVNFDRNRYVDDAVIERALESRAQAEDYMEQVDDLLDESSADAGHRQYADPLRRFWGDCSDLSVKADHVISLADRQSRAVPIPAAVRPLSEARRRSSSSGANSAASSARRSRHSSVSRSGNEIFEASELNSAADINGDNTSNANTEAETTTTAAAAAAVPPLPIAAVPELQSSVGSPRGGTTAPGTPRVREHRDSYLSVAGQQRLSVSAHYYGNGEAGASGAGNPRTPRQTTTPPTPAAGASTASAPQHNSSHNSSHSGAHHQYTGETALPSKQQQQQQQYADPSPLLLASIGSGSTGKGIVRSDRHRRADVASPAIVRAGSRGRRTLSDIRDVGGRSSSNSIINGGGGVGGSARRGDSAHSRRAQPEKPYRGREPSSAAVAARESSEKPVHPEWQV